MTSEKKEESVVASALCTSFLQFFEPNCKTGDRYWSYTITYDSKKLVCNVDCTCGSKAAIVRTGNIDIMTTFATEMSDYIKRDKRCRNCSSAYKST